MKHVLYITLAWLLVILAIKHRGMFQAQTNVRFECCVWVTHCPNRKADGIYHYCPAIGEYTNGVWTLNVSKWFVFKKSPDVPGTIEVFK